MWRQDAPLRNRFPGGLATTCGILPTCRLQKNLESRPNCLSCTQQHCFRQKRQMRSTFSQRLIIASIGTISCRRLSISIFPWPKPPYMSLIRIHPIAIFIYMLVRSHFQKKMIFFKKTHVSHTMTSLRTISQFSPDLNCSASQ